MNTVHPHGCGEHFFPVYTVNASDGSSPRVWGTFVQIPLELLCNRFIPTGVGNIELEYHRTS